jgi:hypothetical protein
MIDRNDRPQDFSLPPDAERDARDAIDAVLRGLHHPHGAPDVTANVMARLGYAPASAPQARRWHWMSLARRGGFAAVILFAVVVGARIHLHTADARRPAEITIPDAVNSAVQEKRETFEGFIHAIRNLTPRHVREQDQAPEVRPEPDALAPYCWV